MAQNDVKNSVDIFCRAWAVLFNDISGADVRDEEGIAFRWTDSPFIFSNAVFITASTEEPSELDALFSKAARRMRCSTAQGLVYLCDEYVQGRARDEREWLAKRAGLTPAITLSGMLHRDPKRGECPDVNDDIRRVVDAEGRRVLADVNASAYGMKKDDVRRYIDQAGIWSAGADTFILYEKGIPVSSASAMVIDGHIYLALVATIPGYQHRGFAGTVSNMPYLLPASGARLRVATCMPLRLAEGFMNGWGSGMWLHLRDIRLTEPMRGNITEHNIDWRMCCFRNVSYWRVGGSLF